MAGNIASTAGRADSRLPVRILEKNRELKGTHAGKRCFIIGNGPSLKEQNLLLLKDDIKIVVNHFHRFEQCSKIAPDYWLCADKLIWENREKFLRPLLDSIEEQEIVTKLFLPLFRGMEKENGLYLNMYYFKLNASLDIGEEIDFSREIPPYSQNVVAVALMLAFYLGCNPIYLIGCDHTWWNWQRDEYENKRTPHFYNVNYPPSSHFISFDLLFSLTQVQKLQYLKLKEYAETRGYQVFNATAGGYLDLFPRVSYETLFADRECPIGVTDVLAAVPEISSVLGKAAIDLMGEEKYEPALVLLNEAGARNTGRSMRVVGLDYLRAVCLTRLGAYGGAETAARQDYICNPSNRSLSSGLIDFLAGRLKLKEEQ